MSDHSLQIRHESSLSATLKLAAGMELQMRRTKDAGGTEEAVIYAMAKGGSGHAYIKLNEEEVRMVRGFLELHLHDPR